MFSINDGRNDGSERREQSSGQSWVAANAMWLAVVGVLIALIIILLVVLLKKNGPAPAADTTDPEAVPAAVADTGGELLEDVELPNNLEQDVNAGVNALIQSYYENMASGNVEGVRALVDVLSDSQASYIESLETLVEEYQNIHCYTKRGMEEGSFVVIACYDLKFVAADTVAPGMETWYVKTNEDGAYYIFLDTPGEDLLAYVNEIVEGEDVQALCDEVTQKFTSALEQDAKLAEYGAKLEQLKEKSEEGAEASTEENPEEGTEAPPEEGEEQPQEDPAQNEGGSSEDGTDVNRETHFADTTNIRSGRSTDTDRVARGYLGEAVTQITDYPDGWSKVNYNGKEGYCKTEYLETAGGDSSSSSSSGNGTAVNKESRFTATTNVRSERNTSSDRVALGYEGEAVTRVEDYSDGWSKVKYNGKEGYCKTEYLE